MALELDSKAHAHFSLSQSFLSPNPKKKTDQSHARKSSFREKKNQREGFIAFCNTEPLPSPNLSREG